MINRYLVLLILIIILTGSACAASAGTDTYAGTNGQLLVHMDIPVDKDQARDLLVAGRPLERAIITIENTGDTQLNNVVISIEPSGYVDVSIPTQPISIDQTDQTITAVIGDLKPHEQVSILLDVKPPESVEYKKKISFDLISTYEGGEYTVTHEITIIPPPSWVTYFIVAASLLIFFGIIIAVKRFGVLEIFTTVDLVTIALIAAIIAVVLRSISKIINMGWFDGLVIAIPTVIMMIVALHLVRKPGTATLLFTVVMLISFILYGTHLMWLGFYLAEGVVVDLLVFLFKNDYADRRLTAVIYGVVRCATATLVFYLLFAPVEWKICYDMWYIYMQTGIACAGGVIGGIIGYDTAMKMGGVRL